MDYNEMECYVETTYSSASYGAYMLEGHDPDAYGEGVEAASAANFFLSCENDDFRPSFDGTVLAVENALTNVQPHVTALAFDNYRELLWSGDASGHLQANKLADGSLFCAFNPSYPYMGWSVREVVTSADAVCALTADGLSVHSAGGCSRHRLPLSSVVGADHSADYFLSMLLLPNTANTAAVSTELGALSLVSLDTGGVVRRVASAASDGDGCSIIRSTGTVLCCATNAGKLQLRDAKSLQITSELQAYQSFSDMDMHGYQVIACGYTQSKTDSQQSSPERFVRVYDIRMTPRYLRPIQPAGFSAELLRFVPLYSERFLCASSKGAAQLYEAAAGLAVSSVMQVTNPYLGDTVTRCETSSTYQMVAFGDSGGRFYVLAAKGPSMCQANLNSIPLPQPVNPFIVPCHIDINDPLDYISKIPTYWPEKGRLSSELPLRFCSRKAWLAKPLPGNATSGSVVHLPKSTEPNDALNHVPYELKRPGGKAVKRQTSTANAKDDADGQKGSPTNVGLSPRPNGTPGSVKAPRPYRRINAVHHRTFGWEPFDFGRYNKTDFTGLENDLQNSYCNAVLQSLYFVRPVRQLMLSHICVQEACIACELGFLFDILDHQAGTACQPGNFLRILRASRRAASLGLLATNREQHDPATVTTMLTLVQRVQIFFCFLLWQVEANLQEQGLHALPSEQDMLPDFMRQQLDTSTDAAPDPPLVNVFERLFVKTTSTKLTCSACQHVTNRLDTTHVTSLEYPNVGSLLNTDPTAPLFADANAPSPSQPHYRYVPFCSVLQNSLVMHKQLSVTCAQCAKTAKHLQEKQLMALPEVLVVNCGTETENASLMWQVQQQLAQAGGPGGAGQPPDRAGVRCHFDARCKRRATCPYVHSDDPPSADEPPESPPSVASPRAPGSWLPARLFISQPPQSAGTVVLEQPPDDADEQTPLGCYECVAVVCLVRKDAAGAAKLEQTPTGNEDTNAHLVVQVRVDKFYHELKVSARQADDLSSREASLKRKSSDAAASPTLSEWFLFNDFTITQLAAEPSPLLFDTTWLLPCTLLFVRTDWPDRVPTLRPRQIGPNVLFMPDSLMRPARNSATFTALNSDEIPLQGDLVGLDAEFVTINREQIELTGDGVQKTVRPSQLWLARVTVVRGKGSNEGVPFIDDYISTQEEVVDYLTQYSGIQPGDLDQKVSKKHLTTLKTICLKMAFLISRGVVFVGHGLKKDFSVMNLFVPPAQIIDTVELFHVPKSRWLSLKFLAWYCLGRRVQLDTHDSVEDSRTALALYRYYEKVLQQDGKDAVDRMLRKIYVRARELHWKVPVDE